MGQILHGSARTTKAVRRAIQNSQESLRALSKRYGINQKTISRFVDTASDLSEQSLELKAEVDRYICEVKAI